LRAFLGRSLRAVRALARDRRIPRPLRGLIVLGALPAPGPFDEALLAVAGLVLVLFYRRPLREAWQAAGRA
jgi:hypothetical protein